MPNRTDSGPERSSGRRGVLLVFAAFAALHAILLPLFEGADEGDNLRYIRFLAIEGRLTEPATEPTFELEELGRGHMPPLWFLSMVPLLTAVGADDWQITSTVNTEFTRTGSGADVDPFSRLKYEHGRDEESTFAGAGFDLRVLRWASIPWALLALWATWHAACRVLGSARRATWAIALIAATPQFQHLTGTVTMDVMLAAWGALALLACVEWCGGGPEKPAGMLAWAALAGAATGMAALTKLNGLVLAPACLVAALLAWRAGRGFASGALACALAFLLVAGPYYTWGFIETGHPLWSWKYQGVSPFHTSGGVPAEWNADSIAVACAKLFSTWLARPGWTAVWFPQWIGGGVFALYVVGAAAACARWRLLASIPALAIGVWLIWAWRTLGPEVAGETEASATASVAIAGAVLLFALVGLRRMKSASGEAPGGSTALFFLCIAAVLMLAAEAYFNLHFAQPQGRHLYPFLTALVVPVAYGLDRLRLLRLTVIAHVVLSVAAIPWLIVGPLRPSGWNASPVYAATDLWRAVDPSLTEERAAEAEVEWVQPRHGSAFSADEPPELVWKIDPESEYDLVLGFRPELFGRNWRPDGVVERSITSLGIAPRGSLAIPADLWASFLPGTSVYLQVVRLGEDGRATGHSTVRELVRVE